MLNINTGSRFRRNFIQIASANMLAQAIPILAAPLLTRLYTPSDFAAVAVFSSILSVLLAFATWRFDWCIPNTASRSQALNLVTLGGIALIIVTGLLALILGFSPGMFFAWKIPDVLGSLVWLLPIALLGSGVSQLLQSWFVKEASLAIVGQTKIWQSLTNTGVSLLTGLLAAGATGLIGATTLSTWAGIRSLWRNIKGLIVAEDKVSPRTLAVSLRQFGSEATLSTMVSLTNTVSFAVAPLLLIHFFSAAEVGLFALLQRLVLSPIGIVTSALGQSFWSEAAQLVSTDRIRLRQLYLRMTLRLAAVGMLALLACGVGALFIEPLLGKGTWSGAAPVLLALSPLVIGQIVFSPLNHLVVYKKQNLQLYADLIRLALVVGSVYVVAGPLQGEFTLVVLLMSISSLLGHLALFVVHLRLSYAKV